MTKLLIEYCIKNDNKPRLNLLKLKLLKKLYNSI